MNLYPLKETAEAAQAWMAEGFHIHQQFICGGCKIKQTCAEEDRFFTHGKCEECGHVTDLTKAGCNYMAISERKP